ncbi:MAG: CoA transferase [candidate division NC10 bacterium]|nr:CoA transferase [candidate division NC10 bacterium]
MAGPLKGMVVLDLSWAIAGPYATLLLRDLGAEVIKIEIPGAGDVTRYVPPYYQGEASAYFVNTNRGKEAITLNLKSEKGKEIFLQLVERADLLIESFRPGTMARLGLSYAELSRRNPLLIYGAISGFGQTGPYSDRAAYDLVAQAMGGTMSVTGEEGGGPVKVGAFIGDLAASLYLVIGILAALKEREKSGQGQLVDISMLDCQVALCNNPISEYLATGEVPKPLGTRALQATPFQVFKTKDSRLALLVTDERQWEEFCRLIQREDLLQDPRFMNMAARNRNVQALLPTLSEIMASRSNAQWEKALRGTHIICCPVYSIDQVVQDSQVKAREMIVEVRDEKKGKKRSFPVVGNPIKLSRSQEPLPGSIPELGEHTNEVLSRFLGLSQGELEKLREEGII